MGLRNEFSDRGPGLEGLEGDLWKDARKGDFVRGKLVRASVQDGRKMNGEPERKTIVVLADVTGKTDGALVAADVATIIASGGRGSGLAEALDTPEPGATVQVAFVATKPGQTTGEAKLWVIKVWAVGLTAGVDAPSVVVNMPEWGKKREPGWKKPAGKADAL